MITPATGGKGGAIQTFETTKQSGNPNEITSYDQNPFTVKDCALLAIATGLRAQNLRELCKLVEQVDTACIYYHFWGGLLRPHFDSPEFPNDFATWARDSLHDSALAERLAIITPSDFETLGDLQRELVDVLEERLDDSEYVPWAKVDKQFHFIHSQIVIFDAGLRVEKPEDLKLIVPHLSSGSIFYHFIDARRRLEGKQNDFSAWLAGFDGAYESLVSELDGLDPYFSSLTEIRARLLPIFARHL